MLTTSLPLGVVSIGVGLYTGNSLLALVGFATLVIGVYAVLHCGFIVLKLVFH